MVTRKYLIIAGLAVAVLAGSGCKPDPIRSFEIPKEKHSIYSEAPRGAAAHRTELPEGWEEVPPTQMRVASYQVKGDNDTVADISVSVAGGNDLDNVNRWRAQVGEQPLTEEGLQTNAQPVRVAGAPARLFEVAGQSVEKDEPTRIFGVIQERASGTWFFKMTGDEKLLAVEKPNFLKFLARYHFPDANEPHVSSRPNQSGPAADPHDPHSDPHAGLGIPPTASQAPVSKGEWPAPDSWQAHAPGPMQDARFVVADGKALVTVSRAGGSMLANVNRWRGQVGLEPVDERGLAATLKTIDLASGRATLVDLEGATQRMVVAIVPKGSQAVFYKLMGEPAAVGQEKDALVEFVKAVK